MPTSPVVFRDYRGLVQLRLSTPEDLAHIHALEPARWSSTSVPISQLLCDEALLRHIDTDENGRIRVQELLAAHDWLCSRLKNRKRIAERTDTVHLEDLDNSSPEASKLRALVKKRIKASGKATTGEGATLSLDEIRAFREGYTKRFPNGDGVITEPQVEDEGLKRLVHFIVLATGGASDKSGEAGASLEELDHFLTLGRATLAWESEGALPAGAEASAVLPFGNDTPAAFDLLSSLSGKLDQFFAQCDLLVQGEAAASRLSIKSETLADLDVSDPAAIRAYLQSSAVGRPNPEGVLDLGTWTNPLYVAPLKEFFSSVVPRALGLEGPVERLDRAGWEKTRALFEPYRAWRSRRPAALPEGLSGANLAELISGPIPDKLRALLIEDQKASAELVGLGDLEKFALLQRWILELANNMVSFPALFSVGDRCLFEVGTLVLDGREINLCVRVEDRAGHRPIAETSNVFVAYAELERKDGGALRTMHIAAGVTSGTRRGIDVGKRGVFYDREGKEWDAKVTDVIVKPISITEAALAPFIALREFLIDKVTGLFGSKLDSMQGKLKEGADKGVEQGAKAAELGDAKPPQPPEVRPAPQNAPTIVPQSALVGGGIAFAAVGSAAAFALQTLANTNPLNALLATSGIVLGVMAISGFLGWLKLRKRDVSTLLEASGWAFNVRIYLRRNLSLRFTRVPPLPKGSVRERSVVPVFISGEERAQPGRTIAILVICAITVVLAIYYSEPLLALVERIRNLMR